MVRWSCHTPQRRSQIAQDAMVILNNRCGVATPTTTISSISVASDAVVKTEHVQASSWPVLAVVDCHCSVACRTTRSSCRSLFIQSGSSIKSWSHHRKWYANFLRPFRVTLPCWWKGSFCPDLPKYSYSHSQNDINSSHPLYPSGNLTTQYTSCHAYRKQRGLANFPHNYSISVFF